MPEPDFIDLDGDFRVNMYRQDVYKRQGLMIHIVYAYKSKQSFIGTPREMFALSSDFVQPILRRAYPLVLNELFFGFRCV